MKKSFYVASRVNRSAQADDLSDRLIALGWERTYRWTPEPGQDNVGRANTATKELNGVREADVFIALLPGGLGTHVEIGAALALGKIVIIHSPDQETLLKPYRCVFHYHPGVNLLVSDPQEIETLVDFIRESCESTKQ
jgi:nucleoside 2-deoxyribosyltransferase